MFVHQIVACSIFKGNQVNESFFVQLLSLGRLALSIWAPISCLFLSLSAKFLMNWLPLFPNLRNLRLFINLKVFLKKSIKHCQFQFYIKTGDLDIHWHIGARKKCVLNRENRDIKVPVMSWWKLPYLLMVRLASCKWIGVDVRPVLSASTTFFLPLTNIILH